MLVVIRRVVEWRWYATVVLATWVLAPEMRRLVDWETSFHQVSPFSILPLLSLMPAIFVLPAAWRRAGPAYRQVSALWFLAFGYATFISLLTGSTISAIYAFALFTLPFLFGIILAAGPDEPIGIVYERTAKSILWLAVITSVYGIYQYVSPPPWDVYWAQQANIEGSQGVTAAFNFRIFGTLNSTGPLSSFLAFAILINVPRLRPSRPWTALMLVPCAMALVLTQVRAEWLALALGLLIYFVLAPQRKAALLTLSTVAALFIVIGAGLLAVVSAEGANTTVANLQQRITTFGSIATDQSTLSREDQTTIAMKEALSEPLGQGLGSSGGSTKLSGGTGEGIDNGFVAHFFEMGFIGFTFYELALVLGIFSAFRASRRFARAANLAAANFAAVAVAVQLVLFVAEIAADQHGGDNSLFFWFSLFIASAFAVPSGARVESAKRRLAAALRPSPSA